MTDTTIRLLSGALLACSWNLREIVPFHIGWNIGALMTYMFVSTLEAEERAENELKHLVPQMWTLKGHLHAMLLALTLWPWILLWIMCFDGEED